MSIVLKVKRYIVAIEMRVQVPLLTKYPYGGMVDALDLKSSTYGVRVQVPLWVSPVSLKVKHLSSK